MTLYMEAVSMSLIPLCTAACTAACTSLPFALKVPSPILGIATPLFRMTSFCMLRLFLYAWDGATFCEISGQPPKRLRMSDLILLAHASNYQAAWTSQSMWDLQIAQTMQKRGCISNARSGSENFRGRILVPFGGPRSQIPSVLWPSSACTDYRFSKNWGSIIESLAFRWQRLSFILSSLPVRASFLVVKPHTILPWSVYQFWAERKTVLRRSLPEKGWSAVLEPA